MSTAIFPYQLRARKYILDYELYSQYTTLAGALDHALGASNLAKRMAIPNSRIRESHSLICAFNSKTLGEEPAFIVPVDTKPNRTVQYRYRGCSGASVSMNGSLLIRKRARDGTVSTVTTHTVAGVTGSQFVWFYLSSGVALNPGDTVYQDWSGLSGGVSYTPNSIWISAFHVG